MTARELLATLCLVAPGLAAADCPADPANETILYSNTTGDDWLNAAICATPEERDRVFDLIEEHMGLDGITLTWGTILSKSRLCKPDGWGGRLIDGAYAVELVGLHRDQDTFEARTRYQYEDDGRRVTNWLRQFIDEYASYDGFEAECRAFGDDAGDTVYTFASNPAGDFAINLYHPWFFHLTAFQRASTLVHEVAHELEGHIGDDECLNLASCDQRFGTVNAQTLQIFFQAEAIDTYQRAEGSRELMVVNFGMDACGYLPLLPDGERFALQQQMVNRLRTVFKFRPPQSQWPWAANTIPAPDPVYDVAQPNGQSGMAWHTDVVNDARWPCAQVCDPTDFDFPTGRQACNEDFHPFENSAINGRNRAKCERLNDQIAEGVTPSGRARLLAEAAQIESCRPGASREYLDATCEAIRANAGSVDEVAAAWPDPPRYVYGYDAERAIRECQDAFCAQPGVLDRGEAEAACYEYDDPTGCLPLQCGDLAALEAEHGRQGERYFQAVLCRASRFGRSLPAPEADGCQKAYAQCMIEDRYRQLWAAQLDGDDCWSDGLERPGDDPLSTDHRQLLAEVTIDDFVAADLEGPGVLQNGCFMREIECRALEDLVALDIARMLEDVDLGPRVERPDIWGVSPNRYDRGLREELQQLAGRLFVVDDIGPIRRRLQAIIAQPEARVAMAEMIGHDRFFRMGGGYAAERYFSPERRARFMGADAQPDPYAPEMVGLPEEEAALATLNARLPSAAWGDLRAAAPALGALRYAQHLRALATAETAVGLLEAHDALRDELTALMDP